MIDISKEPLITLNEAARSLPGGRPGRPLNLSTVFRWVTEGTRGVKLEAVRLGGRWYTTEEALQRFAERLTAAALPGLAAVTLPAGEREHRAEVASRLLQDRGC